MHFHTRFPLVRVAGVGALEGIEIPRSQQHLRSSTVGNITLCWF